MLRILTIMMITLTGFLAWSEYSAYGQIYIDAEAYEDGFAVLGNDGDIHLYDKDSRHISSIRPEGMSNARYMCTVADAVVIADKTSMSCFLDGKWIGMPVPGDIAITGIEDFYGGVIATAEEGKLLFWSSPFDNARTVSAGIRGRLRDIDSFGDRCYAVTDSSEVVTADLALRTHVFDFNSCYSDYYGETDIVSVAAGSTSVCIAAIRKDGSPAAFISSGGDVWSERSMDYLDGESRMMFDRKPYCVTYREYDDCYVMLCEEGTLFHLPACSHCNYPIFTGSGEMTSMAFNGNAYILAGEGIY